MIRISATKWQYIPAQRHRPGDTEWVERYVFGETPRSGSITQPNGNALGIWNGLNDMYLGKRHEVAV
jgi:hypothetical protein